MKPKTQFEINENKQNFEFSEIANFFNGRSIFVTGGTGFIGKVLLEKLLRSCQDISIIYVLVRLKPGSDLVSRIAELLEDPIFKTLKHENSQILSKLVPIQGDISFLRLGISTEDQNKIFETVSIVIHGAATIKFNEKLKSAYQTNVRGTEEVVKLCKSMKQFSALVYISTAYANCNLEAIYEFVYPMATESKDLASRLETMSDAELNASTPLMLENRPNTYAYSKALAEHVLSQESIPIAIVRPSMVTPIWKEPLPGWTDGYFGISGIPALWGKGILRTMRVDAEKVADFIPVDVVVNQIIAAAWEIGTSNEKTLRVYNCCSADRNPVTWKETRRTFLDYSRGHPYHDAIWYPNIQFTSSNLVNRIKDVYQHYLPAILMDLGCKAVGKEQRAVKLYHRINRLTNSYTPFVTTEWKFDTNQTRRLYNKLSSVDQDLFNFQIKDLDWTAYLEGFTIGVRRYILKQDDTSIPEARKQIRKLYWIKTITQMSCVAILFLVIFSVVLTARFV